jgi:hypothetical protein
MSRPSAVLAVSLALAGCGGSAAPAGQLEYDGSYVPCMGVSMTGPGGTTVEPDPDHPSCRQ